MKKIAILDSNEIDGGAYILEPQDIHTLKAVLDYAFHRTVKHGKTIASYKDIQRMRRELGIIDEAKYANQLKYATTL